MMHTQGHPAIRHVQSSTRFITYMYTSMHSSLKYSVANKISNLSIVLKSQPGINMIKLEHFFFMVFSTKQFTTGL